MTHTNPVLKLIALRWHSLFCMLGTLLLQHATAWISCTPLSSAANEQSNWSILAPSNWQIYNLAPFFMACRFNSRTVLYAWKTCSFHLCIVLNNIVIWLFPHDNETNRTFIDATISMQLLRKGNFYASRNLRFPFANHYLYEARNEGILNGWREFIGHGFYVFGGS